MADFYPHADLFLRAVFLAVPGGILRAKGASGVDLLRGFGHGDYFVISSWGTFDRKGIFGREVYFDSLSMFAAFLLAGRWLEVRLRDRTAGALENVLNRLPDSVLQRQDDGQFARVALRRVVLGDALKVLPGEAFPADGVIVRGAYPGR